jgi:hypothetical protein
VPFRSFPDDREIDRSASSMYDVSVIYFQFSEPKHRMCRQIETMYVLVEERKKEAKRIVMKRARER